MTLLQFTKSTPALTWKCQPVVPSLAPNQRAVCTITPCLSNIELPRCISLFQSAIIKKHQMLELYQIQQNNYACVVRSCSCFQSCFTLKQGPQFTGDSLRLSAFVKATSTICVGGLFHFVHFNPPRRDLDRQSPPAALQSL